MSKHVLQGDRERAAAASAEDEFDWACAIPPFRTQVSTPRICLQPVNSIPKSETSPKSDFREPNASGDGVSDSGNSELRFSSDFEIRMVDRPQVPGYEIVSELGRGGMGIVYKARQKSLKRWVALKMIHAAENPGEPSLRTRFHIEAEAVARLQHPNIVQIYEIGEVDGRPFLALEYVPGQCLAFPGGSNPVSEDRDQESGSLDPRACSLPTEREAARLLETVARAIHYTHQRGILHRDLKPDNILVTAEGTPKITDFGLAKVRDQADGPTRTRSIVGTPAYMSPEQAIANHKQIGPAADVYSLGAILYQLLTGRAPFRGATALQILDQVRNQEPAPPHRLRAGISKDLETICLQCLEKDPAKRYASAAALADDLRRFLDGAPIQARPVTAWERLWRSARRRPAALARVATTVAAVLFLVTIGWYFGVANQVAEHRAAGQYQQFARLRDEALFYGLLAPEEGALFVGAEAAANLHTAEKAARAALEIAERRSFPDDRRAEVAADCYTLLLLLASTASEHSLDLLDRARKLGFETRAYHMRRAFCLERAGKSEEAKTETDLANSSPALGALDSFLLGEEQYRRGDWGAARNAFTQALAREPDHFWAQFFLAVCQLKVGQWEAAQAGLNACLSRRPDFVWAYLFRSFANEKLNRLADAEADFQHALLQLDSSLNAREREPGSQRDARYVLFLTRGILHFRQRALASAALDFQAAAEVKPGQYNAYLNLAHVALCQGEFNQAAEHMEKALSLDPPAEVIQSYHLERAQNLLRVGRYEEALRACEAAGRHPSCFFVRGRALLGLGRYGQAESAFDRYLVEGGKPTANVFRGRGLARMKLAKYPEAVEDYSRALELSPDAELYQHRGWAHFFSEAWKLGLRDFAKAIELDPSDADAFTGRGLANVMLGEYRAAVADADRAVELKPRTAEMCHNIACIYAQAVPRAEAELSRKDSRTLAETYRRRALETIRQTLALLRAEERHAFWKDKILPDAALTPLHDSAEFKELKASLEVAR